jgi:hypothetical protein
MINIYIIEVKGKNESQSERLKPEEKPEQHL